MYACGLLTASAVFRPSYALNLTTSGAADTLAANCVAQGYRPGGTQHPGLRSSRSACEHRQSDHPGQYYGMRKAKWTDILVMCDELTQPEGIGTFPDSGIVVSVAKLNKNLLF
jgi:hypothetical protein